MSEREIAVFTISDIINQNAYNNILLRKNLGLHSELTTVQKAFVTQLVNGTLRNLIHIDYIINQFSKTPVKKMKPLILNTIRISVYQIIYMDKIPVSAACNEAVKIVKGHGFKGLSGFVNGVLRNIARNKDNIKYPKENTKDFLAVKYSYPLWILDYWLEDHSFFEVSKMCEVNSNPPKISICVNTLKTDKIALAKMLREENIEVYEDTNLENSLYISKTNNLSETKCYKEGLFHIMDESSILACLLLAPKKGKRVVDVCAAPGGKSFCCGYLMENKGEIISRDIYTHKAELINDGAKRLGIDIISTEVFDATKNDNIKSDYVICDAPCSGLGLVKKKPDIKYNKTKEDVESLSKLQREILSNVQNFVKDKGVLLYSTCTISHIENLDNVKWFCENFDFELEDLTPFIPNNLKFETTKLGYIEIMPQTINSDGFFIARLRRK
ncbi:MAG: 16S rRNA (cytosine(967)-C(5))-methyltransferase RsmB [Lachnospirales bacterium]